jgi:hypothetical protein
MNVTQKNSAETRAVKNFQKMNASNENNIDYGKSQKDLALHPEEQ